MSGDEAIRELLMLDYEFFVRASMVPGLHPCALQELHGGYAIGRDYARFIACIGGSTLDDARRVIRESERSLADAGALTHAKATVLTIVSIHGRQYGND